MPSRRWYRMLLALYPCEFRDEYGDQLEIAFEDRLRAEGGAGKIALWLESAGDLMVSAAREHFDILRRDVAGSLRSFRRSPSFAAAAIATIAAGIGVNTAIFSVVRGALLKPLPFPNPQELVQVSEAIPNRALQAALGPDFASWRARSRTLAQLAVVNEAKRVLRTPGGSESVKAAVVTRDFFPMLGATLAAGRWFTEADEQPGGQEAVLLNYATWRARFGDDAGVVGREIVLDGKPSRVAGVLGPGFGFPPGTEVYLPSREDYGAQRTQGRISIVHVVGRLRKGVPLRAAEAELTAIAADGWNEPGVVGGYRNMTRGIRARVTPLAEVISGGSRRQLLILFAAVGLVLLTACANVANLLLARAAVRRREYALRISLGAAGRRLIRGALTESLTLAAIGGAFGVGLAFLVVRALLAAGGASIPRSAETGIDAAAFCFAALLSAVTGVLFGLAPAAFAARTGLNEFLAEGGRSSGGPRLPKVRAALTVAQIAVALALLSGAALLVRSFLTLRHVHPGFDERNLVVVQVNLTGSEYQRKEKSAAFHDEALRRLSALPGVESVGLTRDLPVNTGFGTQVALVVEGRPFDPKLPMFGWRHVNAEYFRALRIPLRAGRFFVSSDMTSQPSVVIVNEAFARLFFTVETAVGKRVRGLPESSPWMTIAGVSGDVRHTGLASPAVPEVYTPYSSAPFPQVSYAIRTKADPRAVVPAVRSTISAIDSSAAADGLGTMEDRIRGSLQERRFHTLLLVSFGILAVGLACVGVYGTVSYTVSQRAHEMGVRIAVGASTPDIIGLIMREAFVMAIAGLAAGGFAAWAAGRALSGLLFQVSPADPWSIGVAAVALLAAATLAALIPAVRASRLDPVLTLRRE